VTPQSSWSGPILLQSCSAHCPTGRKPELSDQSGPHPPPPGAWSLPPPSAWGTAPLGLALLTVPLDISQSSPTKWASSSSWSWFLRSQTAGISSPSTLSGSSHSTLQPQLHSTPVQTRDTTKLRRNLQQTLGGVSTRSSGLATQPPQQLGCRRGPSRQPSS